VDTVAPEVLFATGFKDTVDINDTGIFVLRDASATAALHGSFKDDYSSIGYEVDPDDITAPKRYYFEYQIYRSTDSSAPPTWLKIYLGDTTYKTASWDIPVGVVNSTFWNGLSEIADGDYYLNIRVKDRISNYNNFKHVAFKVDRKPPQFLLTAEDTEGMNQPDNNTIYSEKSTMPTLKGRIRDGDLDFTSMKATITGGSIPTANPKVYTINPGTGTNYTYPWSWSLSLDDFKELGEGIYTVTVSASDTSEPTITPNTSTKTFTFIKDVSAPTVSFSNIREIKIDKGTWNNGNGSTLDNLLNDPQEGISLIEGSVIRGTFTDVNEVSNIGPLPTVNVGGIPNYTFKYRVYTRTELEAYDTWSLNDSTWKTGYLGPNPLKSASFEINLADAGYTTDGLYWLDIKVADRVSNENATQVVNIAFTVDTAAPVVKITGPTNANTNNTFNGSGITLTGTLKEWNLRSLTVRVNDAEP